MWAGSIGHKGVGQPVLMPRLPAKPPFLKDICQLPDFTMPRSAGRRAPVSGAGPGLPAGRRIVKALL